MRFNEKLRQLREDRGMSYSEVAARIYIAPRAVREWEQGKGYPSMMSLVALAKFYDISTDDLLSEEIAELPITAAEAQSVFPGLKLHEKLLLLRKNTRLSQGQLAERLSVSLGSVEAWERGTAQPGVSSLIKLSKFYGVPIDELLSEDVKRVR